MASHLKTTNAIDALSSDEYAAFQVFLETAAGILLGENKHYLVTSRLNKVMGEFRLSSFRDLLSKLDRDSKLRERVIDAMTTNETSWFRDSHPYEVLKDTILPELAKRGGKNIRIWSAACSTGQEPYSISMCVQEFISSRPGVLRGDIEIIATDLSPTALEEAKGGIYDEMALARGLSAERRSRHFTQKGKHWEVRKEIRSRVNFRWFNLSQSYAALGKFDVIFCRNVLIYFSTDLKSQVLLRMSESLNPKGYFLLGGSESMANYCDAFQMVRAGSGVIYQTKT